MSESDVTATTCEACGEPPLGVTMWEGMDGWSCPSCSHYNEFDHE